MASSYPFSTTWTGQGVGTLWSDPANWSAGVPLTGADAVTATDDVATIDNSAVTTAYTVVISGAQSVAELNVSALDPNGGVAVSLTGTLDMSVNVSANGSGFGLLDLMGGTFEIDGGTLASTDVQLNGGTLAFGARTDTLNSTFVDGSFTVGNASAVIIAQNAFAVFDGTGGYGNAAFDIIDGGAKMSAQGSLYLSGEIDIQSGGTLSLDGGSLNGWGGSATLFQDGGTLQLTANTTVYGNWTIEGGLTFTGGDTLTVAGGQSLALGSDTLGETTVINLGGGTLDVFGTLALNDTEIMNGTVILESGSTYTIDTGSTLDPSVTLTDDRVQGQTNWTGGAGDNDWSSAGNWTNGVPQSGVGFNSDGQSIAVINNAISGAPATITISQNVNAQDIDVATTDPANGPSVLLTGTLDTSWNGEGNSIGQLNLNSGTFEVAGGTISYTAIGLNGGNLAFGSGQSILNQDTINGTWDVNGAVVNLTGNDTVQGQGGGGQTTVTLTGGAQVAQDSGTLALDGTFDIQDGGDNTLFSLDGGNLSGSGGDAATIFIDGGAFAVDANTTFFNTVVIYGGTMTFGSAPNLVATIDSASVTTIGQAGANQTIVDLNGGTLDVFGTLDLTNTLVENGTIILETGAIFNNDGTATLSNVAVTGAQNVTNWTSGVIDNTGNTIDAGATPFTLMVGETIEGGTIVDPGDDVTFAGGTLQGVTYQGTFDLTQDNAAVIIDAGLVVQDFSGNNPGTINITGYEGSLTFDDTQTFDNATINLTSYQDDIFLAVSAAAYAAANQVATPITVTFGADAVINVSGYDDTLGNPQYYNTDYGATTLINNGTINVTSGSLVIDPTNFINNGTITVASGASLDLEGNWSNQGTISVQSGANIELGGSYNDATLATFNASGNTIAINGTLDNTGGTLDVGSGATYAALNLLNGGTIVGGTIDDAGGGVEFSGGTFDNVTYEGLIDLTQSYALAYFSNGFKVTGANGSGSGVIDLAGNQDSLLFNDSQTFDNATINLSGGDETVADLASYNAFQIAGGVATSQTLTLGNNLQIKQIGGYNYLGGLDPNNSALNYLNYGTTTLVNNGIIDVNGGTLIINPSNFINKGTISVLSGATLFLDGNWTNLGTISLASGSSIDVGGTFTAADLAQFNLPGVTLEIGGVLDNSGATLNVGSGQTFTQLTLENGGSIKGGTVIDSGGIIFSGGTLDGVTYDGAINLASQYQSMGVAGGSVFRTADGSADGSITLSAYAQTLSFYDTQTVDNVTINLAGYDDEVQIATTTPYANGSPTPPTTVTLGANVTVNSSGTEFIYGDTGTGSLTNDGTINDQYGTLNLETTNFVNNGTINVSTYQSLYIYGNWSNNGAINVNGGNIYLGGNFDDAAIDSITNNGGQIFIDGILNNAGSILTIGQGTALPLIKLNNGTINGGTISDAGSGISLYGTGTLNDVTYQGAFNLTGTGYYTYFQYGGSYYTSPALFINNGLSLTGANGVGPGQLNVQGTGLPLDFTGTQTIDNATVTLGSGDSINAYSDYTYTTLANLTLGANLIVNASGGANSYNEASFGGAGTIVNDGTINVSAGVLVIDPANFSNLGTINVAAGATLYLEGNWSNAGTINLAAGSSVYLKGSFTAASVTNIVNNGGTIFATTITAPGAVGLTQGFTASISGVSLTDPGAASNQTVTATLTDATGLLSATGTVVSGSGTTTLVVTGTLTQVNAALATLTDIESVVGNDAITIAAVDSSGNSAANKTINVYVQSPIYISTPLSQSLSVNLATPLSAYVSEEGALSGAALTVTISDTTGSLSATGNGVSGSGTNVLTISGSQALINADLATLTINEANPGTDTVTFAAQDGAGDKAQNTSVAITTVSSPIASAPGSVAVTQNSITALSGFSASEPGSLPYETFTVTLSDTTGLLSATGSSATGLGATSITLTGSLAQVNADLATLTLDAPNAGTDTLNLTVSDSFGGTSSQSVAITSTHVAAPDLTVSSIVAPSSGIEGQAVQLTWTVTNSGDATATGPWTDNVYLATDATGDNKTLVGSFTYDGTLDPGQSATETQSVTLPSGFTLGSQTGTAATYFVVQADPNNQTGALSGLQNHLSVAATSTPVTATIGWAQSFPQALPPAIDATDAALIEQRWTAEVGTTAASFASAINAAIAALDQTSASPATTNDALQLLARNAVGGVVDPVLAQVSSPLASTSGLDALMLPTYGSDLTSRNNNGVFGAGWASELNDVGPLGPDNGLNDHYGNAGIESYIQEIITNYFDQYGDFLGQSINYTVETVGNGLNGITLLDPSKPNSDYTVKNQNGTVETFSGTSGLLIGVADSQGNAIAIKRNASGAITAITTVSGTPPTFTVNAEGKITSATNSAGQTVTYNYDPAGTYLLGTTTSAGTTSYQYSTSTNPFIQNALTQVTNPAGATLSYTYTANGDIASQSVNGAPATTYAYSGTNTVTQTTGAGQVTTETYDQTGSVATSTDATGDTATFQRDANGNITAIITPAGETSGYAYNSANEITAYTDPLGNSVQFGYTGATGTNPTSVTDQNGITTQYAYNAQGQNTAVIQANKASTQYTYNAGGQVTQETEASGATIQNTYNAAGELIKEQFSDGTSQSYTYDANGNLASSTAVDGGVTVYSYNAQGLLSKVTDPSGRVESYSYNAGGQETQRVEPDGSITNYAYNANGLLAQITDGNGNLIAKYTYNADGALTEKDTGNGARTLYSYNNDANLTEIKTLDAGGATTSDLTYTYKVDGQIATATSSDGTWTYTYDAASQLTHAVFASTNATIPNQDLTYKYDAAGNRTQTIFNGATTNYTTNNLNQYTSANGTTYSYDANGNLVQQVSGGVTTTYTYNVQNQLVSSSNGTTTTTYTYDALGNIASQAVNGVTTAYVSDPLAINSSATGPLSAVAQAYNASGQATATYTYGNGLTAVTSNGTTSYYNADASGNITSLSGTSGALTDTYNYTPSGTLLASTGNVANPFQFNGVVGAMTQSDGLVTIRARNYDPTTGRFTTQDPSGQAGGIDLYTYGRNNPVNYVDATGYGWSPSSTIAGVAGILLTGLGIAVTVGSGGTLTPLGAALITIGLPAGVIGGAKTVADSLNKPGPGYTLYADTNPEIINNSVSIFAAAVPGGDGLTAAETTFSIASLSDYFNVETAYNYYHPPITQNVTINVPKGGGRGDVHLTTFDGLHYDFQAVGEFVLAKSTVAGDNFQVQIRLSSYGGGADAPTVTTEVGVQVGNDRVTFDGNRGATVWVDGVASGISLTANTLTLAGGTITELAQDSYQVTENTGEIVDISTGSYESYTIALAPSAKPGSVEGLLGSFSGPANAFQLPDGTVLGSSLTSVQLYQTFGNAWRITDATSLLDYGQGQNTATFTDLTHPGYGLPVTSLPTNVVAAATAAVAAAGVTDPTAAADATYDYLVTGDPTFITNAAANGAAAPVTSNAVITQSAPPPPSLGISASAPTVTEISGQTPVTFTVSLTSAATADTVINYAVSPTAIDAGKSYFAAGDFGGTLPNGTVTILAGQSQAQITLDIPNGALGSSPDKWLALNISTPGADPIYASTAQVDILNNAPVAGAAAQPVLEYLPGNVLAASENTPTLSGSGNSYSIDLGNVVQGTPLAALQFALANLASAPADSLNASVLGISGGGFIETGLQSATLINAGYAFSGVTLQASTTTLGAQSEVVTFAAHDVNNTGYSASLPNITLTLTDNVVAAAQASVSTSSIALPDVRVGSSDSQSITVTNTAAAGSSPLDVTLGAATGATAAGSIARLAAGASDSTSLSVGLATTSAGLQSSFVTVNLASDIGNGVEVPLTQNKSVTVSGSVFRAATAAITQSATVVHVGDAGSQTLSVLNSDPADGYSEGLRATVTGTTGNILASGTTGLIAAGTSDSSSIAVSYSTAAAGVVSGQINVGLTSDGTGVDTLAPISIGSAADQFSVQVDNYATADLHETSGGGTLTGTAASGYTLDLGTIEQGSGPATIGLAALNSASGLADLLAGTFSITGDSAFANTGFTAFGGLAAGQSDGNLQVSLSTQNDGTFSETITLDGTGSNASGYSGAVAPVTLTIEGKVETVAPVIAGGTVTGAITELAGTTGSSSPDTVQGTIDFTDTNLTATHAASVQGVSVSGVTTGLPGNATLLSLFSLGTIVEDTASNPGSVAWNFTAPDSTFDYLAAGETLTLTYTVQVAEVGGGPATQNVTVTVTGTNDLPQIAAGTTATASLTEIVAGAHTPADDTASGTIHFTDPDLADTHTASVVSVVASGVTAGLAGNATLLGLLSTGTLTEQAGATAGSVGWQFAAPDATFAYLAPGQTVTLTYTVDVTDNHGGSVAQNVTVTMTGAPGTVVHSSAGGTFSGVAFAASATDYTATGRAYLRTYYNASNAVVASIGFTANGGSTTTVGGVVTQVKTVNTDGSYDLRTYSGGTSYGVAFASYDNGYTAGGVHTLTSYYDASGNVVETVSYQANGGFTLTVGGVVKQIKAVNADGSYSVTIYTAGTFSGYGAPAPVAYARTDTSYTAAGVRTFETFGDASGTVLASIGFTANGGYTTTVGGVITQVKTVNGDGSYDLRIYTAGTYSGTAYASYDNAYSASLFHDMTSYYDASGNVLESISYQSNGGYTITVGGVVKQVKAVNGNGSYSVTNYAAGTFTGYGAPAPVAYASVDTSYTAGGQRTQETFADGSGTVLASVSFTANGGYTTTVGNVVVQVRTVNADGSALVETENVVGKTFTEQFAAYNQTDKLIANSLTLTNGSNTSTLSGSGLMFADVAGTATVGLGADTFQLGSDTHGTLNIAGAANATLAFGTGDGAQIITGFATSGAGADVLSFSSNVFTDYVHLMNAAKQQGNDLLITLDASDTLLLKNVSSANFTSSNAKFV